MSVAASPDVWINGRRTVLLDARDRGLHYGDGLFETLRCESGHVRWLDRHLRRLQSGCERLRIAPPDMEQIRTEIIAAATGRQRALLKLIVTRGPLVHRGYRPSGTESPTRVLSVYDWPEDAGTPLRVIWADIRLAENPALAGIKHLNRLEQVLAQQQAAAAAADEIIMLSSRGLPICGSMSNLIMCREGGMLTPTLEQCGVRGVMRSLLLDAAAVLAIPVAEVELSVAELQRADALYCSNIRWGLRRVAELDGRSLGSDPRIDALQAWIDAQP